MKRIIKIGTIIAVLFLAGTLITVSGVPNGDPWQEVWDAISGLQDRVQTIENQLPQPGFMNTYAYDSGWINITGMVGQNIVFNHNLGSSDIIVEIQGRTTATGGIHQKYLGLSSYTSGWSKTYGGLGNDVASGNIVQTSDGGFAVAGDTTSFGAGSLDAWLVKTDAVGNMQWNMAYGGADYDTGFDMIQTKDGGYAIGGYTNSSGAGNFDGWLVKVNSTGVVQWSKTYGGTGSDQGYVLIQTSDGGYAMIGSTTSYGAGAQDTWLVKTDANGVMLWSKTYGGTGTDTGNTMVQTSDGGYAIAGRTNSFGAGGDDVYLVKTDAAGVMQWSRAYGGAKTDYAFHMDQSSEGGYIITGLTASFGAGAVDAYFVKTDALGNMLWSKTYGGSRYDYGWDIIQTSDGGYVIGGQTASFGLGTSTAADFWLVKTDIELGLAQIDSSANSITLHRGASDVYWNFVRVRIWKTT